MLNANGGIVLLTAVITTEHIWLRKLMLALIC